jgi:hypothetical protein
MGEVMLRYRSAAFLVRFYAPDVMLGYHTAHEAEDVGFAAAPSAAPLTGDMLIEQARPVEARSETTAEAIGDEIPSFDPDTGEIASADDHGFTEVDEETARQLDAGEAGPAPEPEGDQADAEQLDAPSPAEQFIFEVRAGVEAAKNSRYLKAVDDKWVNNRVAYDDQPELQAEIDGLINAKRKALNGAQGEEGV